MSGKVSGNPLGAGLGIVAELYRCDPPPWGGVKIRRLLTSAHPLTTIAIPGLNGGRVGVEVGGDGGRESDGVGWGGRGSDVGRECL